MAYQPIKKPIIKYPKDKNIWDKKKDCKDFKSYTHNIRYCGLSDTCKKCGYHYDEFILNEKLCTGIKIDRW